VLVVLPVHRVGSRQHAAHIHPGSKVSDTFRKRREGGAAWASQAYLQRALREAWMPALAMVTVCCSITSWIATRS
jgi:hypothetical protein